MVNHSAVVQPQPAPLRRWAAWHPVAFGILIGLVGGIAVGASQPYEGQKHFGPCIALGAGVGVGMGVEPPRSWLGQDGETTGVSSSGLHLIRRAPSIDELFFPFESQSVTCRRTSQWRNPAIMSQPRMVREADGGAVHAIDEMRSPGSSACVRRGRNVTATDPDSIVGPTWELRDEMLRPAFTTKKALPAAAAQPSGSPHSWGCA
jgi:hypothetical protein